MESIEDLIHIILRNKYTIVFSNLGRYPLILFRVLEAMPHLQIAVQSPHIKLETHPNLRVIKPNATIDACHLLVVVEPSPRDTVVKPTHVLRVVVFTSQLNFHSSSEIIWTHVVYFHDPSNLQDLADNTKRLLSVQDGSFQTHDLEKVFEHLPADSFHIVVIQGRKHDAIHANGTYVAVDLIHHTSPFEMLLAFWDAFDFMLANADKIKRWCVFFPLKNGRKGFEQCAQNCIDKLLCMKIDHGNVRTLAKLMALVPFYQSGCIDRKFDVPSSSFGNLEYVAVKSPQEACRAATKYDLEHWVGAVYHVKE